MTASLSGSGNLPLAVTVKPAAVAFNFKLTRNLHLKFNLKFRVGDLIELPLARMATSPGPLAPAPAVLLWTADSAHHVKTRTFPTTSLRPLARTHFPLGLIQLSAPSASSFRRRAATLYYYFYY